MRPGSSRRIRGSRTARPAWRPTRRTPGRRSRRRRHRRTPWRSTPGPDGTLTRNAPRCTSGSSAASWPAHKPQDHPAATFFGGGPAAGKSTALKATHPDTAHIDPDEIKAQLPEYQQMIDAKDPRAASYVHEESSQLAKQATREAQERRLNFTLDGTGDSDIAKMAGKVNDARKHGYMTEGKYVTTGTDEAVKRAKARAAATGRHVPETFIRETHAAVSDTYAKAVKMGLFDKTELWDTTGAKPALVAHKEPGGKFTVADQAAWQQFLGQGRGGHVSRGEVATAILKAIMAGGQYPPDRGAGHAAQPAGVGPDETRSRGGSGRRRGGHPQRLDAGPGRLAKDRSVVLRSCG